MFFFIKLCATVFLVLFLSWLSKTKPALSGFITVMPTTSLLVAIFSYLELKEKYSIVPYYKGMIIGLPALVLFYLPFIYIKNFWGSLSVGYVVLTSIFFTYRHFNLL